MPAGGLISARIRRVVMVVPIVAALVSLPTMIGCRQRQAETVRLSYLEERVRRHYETQDHVGKLLVTEAIPGEPIEGFCVLSAYEDRVTPGGEGVVAINSFLEAQSVVGSEEYWHLVVKTHKGFRLARFDSARTPLISPRPAFINGSSCVTTGSIAFIKTPVLVRGMRLLGIGPRIMIVIDVKPGD